MKNECREFLQEYVSKHCYGNSGEYDFYTLFKHFSAFEIRCKEDIHPAIDEFFAFLVACNEAIFKSGIKNPPKLMRHSAKVMKTFFAKPMTAGQKNFADIIKTVAPKKEKTSILEVGAGMYPKVAIYMAETFDSVYAIDSQFILSSASLLAMNVNAYQQFFDVNTQIKDYDFIVGRCPCYAIESIVQSCSKQNKPYMIELCDCALPDGAKVKSNKSLGWLEILKGHDANIKVGAGGFVYNIDANSAQIQRTLAMKNSIRKKSDRQVSLTPKLPLLDLSEELKIGI